MDTSPEAIEDEAIVAQIRQQARRVQMQSLLAAVVMTMLSLILPA